MTGGARLMGGEKQLDLIVANPPLGGGRVLSYTLLNPIIVKARATDPETSHAAAHEFSRNQKKIQRSIDTVVTILNLHGLLSDFGIREKWAEYWGPGKWSYTLPSKARHWARGKGLVKRDGHGIHLGRKVIMWSIGRDEAFLDESAPVCPTCGRKLKKNKLLGN